MKHPGIRAYDVYVAGPIRGYENGNRPAFYAAQDLIKDTYGWRVTVPHDIPAYHHDGPCPHTHLGKPLLSEHTDACYLRGDLIEMLQCDGIALLPGWEASAGARLEFSVASQCGMDIWHLNGALLRRSDGMAAARP